MRLTLYLLLCLHLSIKCTTGNVVLIPPQNYTVFENNASAVFNCSGNGYVVAWYLNGSGYNAIHAQMGIRVVPAIPTGGVISSSLYIPSNSTNNNTEVMCKVADSTFSNVQTSNSSNLTVQGPLDAPYNFSVTRSNTSFILSWGAPFSLNVTKDIEIFNYTLCTNITIYGCKTIPSDPDCTFPRTCTSSVDFTDPSLNGTNKTIMDYGDTIMFTFSAINGAGIGNRTKYIFNGINDKDSRIQVSPSPTETVSISTIPYTNSFTSDHSIGLILVGVISGAAVIVVVLFLVIAILVAIACFKKKKSYFEPSSEYNDYCAQSTSVELTDPVYFLPLSYFRPATSQGADKSCIEFGIQHQSNKEECEVESGYADVVCVPIISIPAPKQVTHPPSGRKSRNPSPHRVESDGDDEGTCSYPSNNRSPHQRRIESDGDAEDAQPSEQISSTPPSACRCDNVVSPAESNKEKTSELPMPINPYSCPSTKRSRIKCDEDDDDPPKVPDILPSEHTSSSPPSTCRCDNVVSPAESNNHEPSKTPLHGEEKIQYLVKDDDTPKAYTNPSTKKNRTQCDGDDENSLEKSSDETKCDGDDENSLEKSSDETKCDGDDENSLEKSFDETECDGDDEKSLEKSSDETEFVIHGHEISNAADCCLDTCSANDGCPTNHQAGQTLVASISDENVCQKTNKDTLQEELQHILPHSKVFPSMECSSKDISTISEYSFDWRLVGRHLLNDNKIKDIDNECGNEGEKRKKMLLEWKRTKSFDATYRALAKVLSDVGYNVTADDVEKLEISQAQSINFLTAEDIKPDFHKICSTSSPSYYPKESISIEYIEDDNSDFYWCQEATTEKKANITQQFSSGLLVAKGTSQSEKTSSEMIDEHINDRIQNTKKELSSLNNNAAASSENEERTVEQWDLSKTSICTCTFRIMVQRDLRKITIRMQTKFGAAGVGKTHLQHFLMNNPPEQCFSTGLADNPIKAIYSSLEDDWFLYKELIEKAILPSRYQEIMIAIKGKDHPSKAWKTFLQAVKAIGEGVIFWLLLDVAYGQALYAKNKQCI